MKKIILTAAAVFAFGFANAQDTKFGARAGMDMAMFSGGGSSESLTGFFVGGFAEFELSDGLSLQPGVSYHSASKTVDLGEFMGVSLGSYKLESNAISIPVLFKYNVAESINLIAGPSLFYSTVSGDTDKTRFNLELGASYDITENLFFDPRYSLNLNGEGKVNHLLIGLGYKF